MTDPTSIITAACAVLLLLFSCLALFVRMVWQREEMPRSAWRQIARELPPPIRPSKPRWE